MPTTYKEKIAEEAFKALKNFEEKVGKKPLYEEVLIILRDIGAEIEAANFYDFELKHNNTTTPIHIAEIPLFDERGNSIFIYVDDTGDYRTWETLPKLAKTQIENLRKVVTKKRM